MDILGVVIVLGLVLFSMILHELAHGLVAYWLGDETAKLEGRLTLNPLKHLDPVMSVIVPVLLFITGGPIFGGAKPVPVNTRNLKGREWGMALVAVAGPLMNLSIAFVAFLIGHATGLMYEAGYVGLIFVQLVVMNLGFMIFNLIPIPPLDGSRILYAIAPDGVRNVMMKIESAGILIIYALLLVFSSAFSALMVNGINGVYQVFRLIVGA